MLHAFWATESGLLAALAGRLLGIPTLVSLAGGELVGLRDIDYGDQRHLWERLKVRASLRLASAVTAGSALLVARAGGEVSGNRLYRAPLGVDLRLFTPDARRAGGGARLIHVATLTRVKDQATLLRAFAGLRQRRRDASLEIVGSGPLRAELERMVHALDLTDAVQFRGELDHAALPEAYRSADGFVLSSRHEAQGMVALEAAACGLPVAGTSVGVLPELTGDVAPVGASETLAAAMAATLAATAVPTPRLRSEFGLDECTDRFRALYASLLAA